jgi:hypothetical protein
MVLSQMKFWIWIWAIVIIDEWCLMTKLSYPINSLIKVALQFTIHYISGSQGICGYISVMAALKFTFLIKKIMFC